MITEMGGKVEKPNYSMPGFITEMSVRNPVPQPPPATITERDMPLPGARPPAPVPLPKQSRGRMLNLPTQGVVNGVLVAVVSQVSYSEEAGSVWKLEDGTTVADREISFLQG